MSETKTFIISDEDQQGGAPDVSYYGAISSREPSRFYMITKKTISGGLTEYRYFYGEHGGDATDPNYPTAWASRATLIYKRLDQYNTI